MKIEKVNENKIKITLSREDLNARNIDVQSFIYNTPESQDLFWDVMREAEKEYGFNVDESMVYVEASATTSGIFTLTVTKTSNSLASNTLKNKIRKQNYKLKRKSTSVPLDHSLYRFDSFDDFCDFAKLVAKEDYGENSLYEFDSHYYLYISTLPNNLVLEYAIKEHNTDVLLAEICEYGTTIVRDRALKTIAENYGKPSKKSTAV